ncbi:MAG: glycosyltransferase family 2 protein [Bacteroidota bacterium]
MILIVKYYFKLLKNSDLTKNTAIKNKIFTKCLFQKYYSSLGVDRFFVLDNCSTDNTIEVALQNRKTHVFRTNDSYKNHWIWMEYMLEKYSMNGWCLVVDVDELFQYPFFEKFSLRVLTTYLSKYHFTAVRSILLDIYSKQSIQHTTYEEGQNPLEICQYFDSKYSKGRYFFKNKKNWKYFNGEIYSGGVRTRVFQESDALSYQYCLNKISLFKYSPTTYLVQGMHAIDGAKLADIQGVVIHTKYLSDFISRVKKEAKREEHFSNAIEYKIYESIIDTNSKLSLYYHDSKKYVSSEKLASLGFGKSTDQFEAYLKSNQVTS